MAARTSRIGDASGYLPDSRRYPGWYPAAEEAASHARSTDLRRGSRHRRRRSVVRAIGRRWWRGSLGRHPGSVVVAAFCVVLAGILVVRRYRGHRQPERAHDDPGPGRHGRAISEPDLLDHQRLAVVDLRRDLQRRQRQRHPGRGRDRQLLVLLARRPRDQVRRHHPSRRSPKELFTYRRRPGSCSRTPSYLERTSSSSRKRPRPCRSRSIRQAHRLDDHRSATRRPCSTSPMAIPAAMTAGPDRADPRRAATSRRARRMPNGNGVCDGAEIDLWDVLPTIPRAGPASSCWSTRTRSTRRPRSPGCSVARNGTSTTRRRPTASDFDTSAST